MSGPIAQNPFDFSNPVTDRSVLAGRAEEMKQATYYLGQSREGAAYSLALVGERASGKTSLLNALADYAEETGLIAAHVRLDEGITGDDLDFFREVFHSLMEACALKGMFGGKAGAEYDTFCRQILMHDLDTERANEPLAFGRVYATARAEDRSVPLSRRMLLSDLNVLVERSRKAGFPAVVLLIDEGDLLAGNHALLQAIRNLLMDSSHFSLIAAGTEQMFPAISDVFSPVPRQFVRINVGPFAAWEDTRKAILRRLTLSGQEWAMPGVERCREIHSLTRGSPYEVMLVSHFAYRELTRKRQRVPMAITADVIGAVADQLAQQNPAVQETLTKLRELDNADAETVRELIELDGLSLDQFALATLDFARAYSERGFKRARDSVKEMIDRLAGTGFVSAEDGALQVVADSFQRALIKYVVLGRRDSGQKAESRLKDPRQQVGDKVIKALREALLRDLDEDEHAGMITELHRGGAQVSLRLTLADRRDLESYAIEDYSAQVRCQFEADAQWTGLFVLRREHDSSELRGRIRESLAKEAKRLRGFGVEMTELEVEDVRPEAIAKFKDTLAEDNDLIEDLVEDARDAFREGRPDYREKVVGACSALLENEVAEDAERWHELNDCAFMALGAGDVDSYKLLSDRAEKLDEAPILSTVTRALWEAVEGRHESALKRLEIGEGDLDTVPDPFRREIWMYSPAALAGDIVSVDFEHLVGGVELDEVIEGYRVAILARMGGLSVAEALGGLSAPSPWLLGAAADAAEAEGQADLAAELRRKAAVGAEPEDKRPA